MAVGGGDILRGGAGDDVYVVDSLQDTVDEMIHAVSRASVSALGAQANGPSVQPVLSADGSRLLFLSDANNLLAGEADNRRDIFIRDLPTGAVTMVSGVGTSNGNGHCFSAQLSANG